MYDLTAFQRDILYVIFGLDDTYGLAIRDELADYYDEDITPGRLYQSLDALVSMGLVHKGQRDGRTNVYSLTSRGRRELEARRAWEGQYISRTSDEVEGVEVGA